MTKLYSTRWAVLILFVSFAFVQSALFGQVSLVATGGTPAGSYATVSDAFAAINAGTHTGNIGISIDGNTTEPATPTFLLASGQGASSYTAIGIKPSVTATISGATSPGYAVINFDGADNVTIDGSIAIGGTTQDLTIQNTAAPTTANVACIRLIGRTTLGLGATNISITNCNLVGSTSGNTGFSGSTVTSTYGIYAGSTSATTMSNTATGIDYDNVLINNNVITNAYIGVYVFGATTTNQADNLVVTNNTFGAVTNGIGFKGFMGSNLVGGNFTNNSVSSIVVNTGLSIAGVEVAGTGTNGFQINRNTIYDIRSLNTGGWGAWGVNVTGGTGVVISNNVIYGLETVNYNFSTQYNAFGIRLTGGTGHRIYYNSICLSANYTNVNFTQAFSSGLIVTSTGVTGLDIRNNIFDNRMTSNAGTIEFCAVAFPASYNFTTTNLDNNGYMVSNDAQHHIGKIGATAAVGLYTNLNNWRSISQVGNAANDVNSVPGSGNLNAPFTSVTNLTIPAATVTVLESAGLPIAFLGLPNVDRTNINRPAGSGTNPDIGAYEFEGTVPADVSAPVVSSVSAAPGSSCTLVAHTVTAMITDNTGVASATLSYSYNGVAQTPIAMTLSAGTALNGTYTAVIPAAPSANTVVAYSVQAVDGYSNISMIVSGTSYTDEYLVVTASADQLINTGTPTTVSATTNDPSFGRLLISEVIQFRTGTGDGVYPNYVPAGDNDFVEIVNFGDVDANAGGYSLTIYGGVNGSYTIPANTIIPSGGTLVLGFSGTVSDPVNRYFGMNLATTSSNVANGYVLRNPQGTIKDVVATNSYVFGAPSGVTALDWSGALGAGSGLAGARRTAASDNNVAADWTLSGAANVTNIGVYNSEITIVSIPQTITWTNSFNANVSTANPLPVSPFASPGSYWFYATFSDGTCTVEDSVNVVVIAPVPPVASFTAAPLAGSAPLIVSFTDLSTNIPTSWAWTVSPMTGVTYVSGTTASSQNPVMQFTNAGLYTITLVATNVAGSDDSTQVQYIDVDWCSSFSSSTVDTDIGNVTFGSLNNGSATPVFNNASANGTYTDFTALTPAEFGVGQTYPISLSQITSGSTFYNAYFNVFIDYDNDGYFDPSTERVFSGATSSTGPISDVSGTVTIAPTATLGTVRMRVVLQEGGNISSPPCGSYGYGETEDYLINILCASSAPVVGPESICSGDSITLMVTGTDVQWYADQVTSTALASGTSSYMTGPLSSTTSYFVTSTDAGCAESDRSEIVVTVNQTSFGSEAVTECDSYTWPIDGMTYTASGTYVGTTPNAVGCDSIITLDLIILNSTGSTTSVTECDSYFWPLTGMTYTTSGSYDFIWTNSVGCDSVITLDLTINTVANVGVTNNANVLTANQAPGAGISYQWMNCAGGNYTPIPGATSQSYTPSVNGSYAVQITENGCADTSACTIVNTIGLSDEMQLAVQVMPNPTDNAVSVVFPGAHMQLTILDVNGKLIEELEVESGDQIDLSDYEPGVYLFNMNADSFKVVRRVVKQ